MNVHLTDMLCKLVLRVQLNNSQQVMQWHLRLEHPSFIVLEKIFLFLTKRCDLKTLLCDACYLQTHTCLYPSRNNKVLLNFIYLF